MNWPVVISVATIAWLVPGLTVVESQGHRVVRVTAERFSFTPSELKLEEGEEVELRIRSDDTAHGFRIVGTGVNRVIPKRGKGELSILFKAPGPGRYTFECTRMCGAGHNFMRGELIVRPATSTPREP